MDLKKIYLMGYVVGMNNSEFIAIRHVPETDFGNLKRRRNV